MKYAWIRERHERFSVARMCRQLGVSRTGYSQWRTRPPSGCTQTNAAPDVRMAAIHANSKRSYGRPRIVRYFGERGVKTLARQPSSFLKGRWFRSASSALMAALSSAKESNYRLRKRARIHLCARSTLCSTVALSRGLYGLAERIAVP